MYKHENEALYIARGLWRLLLPQDAGLTAATAATAASSHSLGAASTSWSASNTRATGSARLRSMTSCGSYGARVVRDRSHAIRLASLVFNACPHYLLCD